MQVLKMPPNTYTSGKIFLNEIGLLTTFYHRLLALNIEMDVDVMFLDGYRRWSVSVDHSLWTLSSCLRGLRLHVQSPSAGRPPNSYHLAFSGIVLGLL